MDKLKKVFSPGKARDDEVMYGTPSKEPTSTSGTTQAPQPSTLETSPDAAQKDQGVGRQIFNPSGDKYSEQSYGTTATATPTMADQLQKEPATSEPLKGAETSQYNANTVQQEPLGSTSTSGAAGTTSIGPSTMAREDDGGEVSNATYTARSYALGSGQSADPQQTSMHADEATRATTDLGPTGDEPSREYAGRRLDHSLAGAGTGGAGAGYVGADELNEFMKHGRDPEADQATYTSRDHYVGSSSEADPFNTPGHELYSADKGPEGVQSAGEMAPGHIPGEFPSEDGGDPHSSSSGVGTGTAAATGVGAGAAGIAASKAYNDRDATNTSGSTAGTGSALDKSNSPIQTTTNTMRSGSFSKPSQEPSSTTKPEEKEKSGGFKGALAAATAAMGLGGAGAYAASRDDKDDSASKPTETTPSSQNSRAADSSNVAPGSVVSDKTQSYTQHRPGKTSTTQSETTPAAASEPRQPEEEDHTARNAALGAGAVGATGAGAYALGRDRDTNDRQSVVSDKTQTYAGSQPSDNTSTEMPTRSAAPTSESQSREPEKDDNTARNAALGAGGLGAAGAGAYALSKNDSDSPSATNTGSPSTTNTGNAQSVVSEKTQSYARHRPSDDNPELGSSGTSAPSSRAPPTSQAQQPEEDHTARNVALGTGAAGAAGAGAYALSNRDDDNTGNSRSVVSPETQKYSGSHPSDTNPSYQSSSTTAAPSQSQTTSTTQQPRDLPREEPREEDHTARNAALGAGGLGAAGAGAYALSRDDDNTGNSQSVVSPETQKYSGSHPSDTNPSYQSSSTTAPTSQPQATSTTQQPREEDHTARNAALGAGGVGAAGAGAYALSGDDNKTGNAQSVVSPETQKYSGSRPSDTNPDYRSSGTAPTSQSQTTTSAQQPPEEDHTARNAALGAGGLGAAGAGAYAMSRDEGKTGATESVVSPDTQKYSGSRPETSKTTEPTSSSKPKESIPSRTKETPISSRPTETSEYSRSAEPPREEDHTARNAALGAGGVGAAGAGAYALSRGDEQRSMPTQAPTSSQPSSATTGYPGRQDDSTTESTVLGAGSSIGATDSSTAPPQQEDHTARNAALGAGGLGAAGAGAYAMSRGDNDTGPASKTLGPHDSNAANVMDPRAKPEPTQQYERTTAGPYQSNMANKMDPRVKSDPAAAQQEQDHNYGRDAAIAGGAGAAGAGGYGAYQYANRGEPTQQYAQQGYPPHQHQEQYPTQQQSQPEQVRQPNYEKEYEHDPRVAEGSDGHNKLHKKGVEPQEEDHTGRNAALGAGGVGAAGAAGYGAKEYSDSKQDTQSTTDSQEGEKKHGFMHKILHPREHKREKEEEERRRSSDNRGSYEQSRGSPAAPSPTVAKGPSGTEDRGGSVTEPHTGLPMNVGKYGSGQGGTDGGQQIEGYQGEGTSGSMPSGQTGRPY